MNRIIDRDKVYRTGEIPDGAKLFQDDIPWQVLDMKKGIIKEEINGKSVSRPVMRVTGVFQKAEEKNANGRIYPLPVLKEAVGSIQKPISERRVLGELDHPNDAKIHMDRVCHLITKLWLEGNSVYGESEILNDDRMPCGSMLACLLDRKVPVGVSSRGVGDMDIKSEGGEEAYLVQPGYQIVTFDAVADPSVTSAQMKIMESRQRFSTNKMKPLYEIALIDELMRVIRQK